MLLRFFTLLIDTCSPGEAVRAKAAAEALVRRWELERKARLAEQAKRSLAGVLRGPGGGSGSKSRRRARGEGGMESGRFAFQSPGRGGQEETERSGGEGTRRGSRGGRRGQLISSGIVSSTDHDDTLGSQDGPGASLASLNRMTGGTVRRSSAGGARHSRFAGIFVAGRSGAAGGTPGPSSSGQGTRGGIDMPEEVAQADEKALARLRAEGQGADGRLHHTVDALMAARQNSAASLGMQMLPGAGRKRVGGTRQGMKGAIVGSGAAVA